MTGGKEKILLPDLKKNMILDTVNSCMSSLKKMLSSVLVQFPYHCSLFLMKRIWEVHNSPT